MSARHDPLSSIIQASVPSNSENPRSGEPARNVQIGRPSFSSKLARDPFP